MRRIRLLILCHFGLWAGPLLAADVVTLKDGRQISGSVESGNTQELHFKAGDQSRTIDIHEVQAIQFGSAPAPPAKAAETAPAQPNSLILRDGTHVGGRWWSIDEADVHFLVDNQLQHFPRRDVLGVTFGGASLPPPPPSSTPPAVPPPAHSSASAAQPDRPILTRPSTSAPPAPASASPSLTRPAAAPRTVSQPDEIGRVYFWNGKGLVPLEVKQAVPRGSGSSQYYEVPGPKSSIRIDEASKLVFILRLPKGVDPAGYSLFPLASENGGRRTRSQNSRQGGLVTWPVDIAVNDASSLMTYQLTVRDLPAGEYSFSPSSSNDGYCFGIDPAPAGQ